MPRSRNIKPGFFSNEHLAALPYETRLLFIGLWTLADREGRLEDRPVKIKMQLFPANSIDVDDCLNQLARAGEPFIERYEVDGVGVVQIVNWSKHQKPHHQETVSTLPEQKLAPTCEPTSLQGAKRKKEGISKRESGIRDQTRGDQKSGIGDQEATTPEVVFDYFIASNATVKPKSLSEARRKKLQTRLKVDDWPWREAIDKLPIPNKKDFDFQPDLDWLIRNDENARKVAEGRYDKRSSSSKVLSSGTRYDEGAEGFGDGF